MLCVAVVFDPIFISFHAVPFTVNVVTVFVVHAVNRSECASEPSSFRSLNVLFPDIVIDHVDAPLENQTL